ncbi:MAG: hypothetical protein CME38_13195 [Haliea sp.]|nr:hypothetical protein [Haliea sp.]
MKVLVTTLVRNEERIIPYFIHHYADIADKIVLCDHESTDNTVKVARQCADSHKVDLEVHTIKNNGYDEVLLKNVKENVYRHYREEFDIAIVVDADEFVHHPEGSRQNLQKLYEKHRSFVVKPKGYQMVSKVFPEYSGVKLTEIITEGAPSEGFSKKGCFTCDLNMSIAFGMHLSEHFDSEDQRVEPLEDSGFYMLHYKYIELEHRIESINKTKNNLSAVGREMVKHGINKQFLATEEKLTEDFYNHYEQREQLEL